MLLELASAYRCSGDHVRHMLTEVSICFVCGIAIIATGCNQTKYDGDAIPVHTEKSSSTNDDRSSETIDSQIPRELRGEIHQGLLRAFGDSLVISRRELDLMWMLGAATINVTCGCDRDRVIDLLWQKSDVSVREKLKGQGNVFVNVIKDEQDNLKNDSNGLRDFRLLSVCAVIHRGAMDGVKSRPRVLLSQHISCREIHESLDKAVAQIAGEDAASLTILSLANDRELRNLADDANVKELALADSDLRAQIWITFIAPPEGTSFQKESVAGLLQMNWEMFTRERQFYYSDNAWRLK